MILPLAARIAFRHLVYRKRQSLVSILGVALGVGFFIALAAMMQGFQSYFLQTVVDVSPHIIINDDYRAPLRQPAEVHYPAAILTIHGLKPKEERRGIRGYEAITNYLHGLPGIQVSQALEGQIFLTFGSTDRNATVQGIVPADERRVIKLDDDLIAGSFDNLETVPNGIIVGIGLAERLGAGMGDRLTAVSTSGVIMQVKIVGLIETGITAIDRGRAYMLLKKVQVLQGLNNRVSRINIRLPDPERAQDLASQLEQKFRYRAESWQEANAGIFGVFVVQNIVMYSTVTAIMIVAAFGIFNIISTIIHEKVKDIAILRSLGFYEKDIRAIFILQGVALGLLGALLGWLVGYGLTSALAAVRVNIKGEIKTDHLMILWSFNHYLLAALFSLAAAIVAAWIPARKAASVQPVEIIRGVS